MARRRTTMLAFAATSAALAVVMGTTATAAGRPDSGKPAGGKHTAHHRTGPLGQPIDEHGNPVPVPAPQPVFPAPAPAAPELPPGQVSSPGQTRAQVIQQAIRAQGADAESRGKPTKGSAEEGQPRTGTTPAPRDKKPKEPKAAGARGPVHPAAALPAAGRISPAMAGGDQLVVMTAAALPSEGTALTDSDAMAGHDHAAMMAAGDTSSTGHDHAVMMAAAGEETPPAVQGPTGLPRETAGRWSLGPSLPSPSIHSVVLNTGKVLLIAGSQNQWEKFAAGTFTSVLWDPKTDTFKDIATPHDMFCNGHVVLRDGRVLVAGGTTGYPAYDEAGNLTRDWKGSTKSYIFDPIKEIYEPTDDLNVGRWYPTLTRMGNDQVVAVAGLDEGSADRGGLDTPVNEIFTPTAGSTWDNFLGGSWDVLNTRAWPQYAHMILTDDGELFYTGQSTANNGQMPGLWEPYSNSFREVDGLPHRWQRNAGGSVLLPPAQDQRVMVMGGGDWQLQSLNDTHIVDLQAENPSYTEGPPMANPKMYVGAVTLPDYTVLQTNGAIRFREGGVRDAQIYDPKTNEWSTMNSPTVDRLYHSTAFLLPDGRVASLGSQVISGENELRMEIFEPPYLFQGQRPTIESGPTWIDYNTANTFTYDVTTEAGAEISKVSLLRPSATTHSTDTEQRLVDLPFTATDGQVSVSIPTNRNLLPPGWYMMTVLDNQGRPSVAKWISLN